jgi:adenylylsulfate kinase
MLLWFTGLSGSGKSTVSEGVTTQLRARGEQVALLDGDRLRAEVNADLGYSLADRREHLRRVGALVLPLLKEGGWILGAFISPLRADRAWLRELVGPEQFVEVYCRCPLEACEARDAKGLYRRARRGEIEQFTGISSPYEPPEAPAITLETDQWTPIECIARVLEHLDRYKRLGRIQRVG